MATWGDLANVIDLEAIRSAGVKIGVDPLGGAAAAYWQPVVERYGIDITIVNPKIDPTFAFMTGAQTRTALSLACLPPKFPRAPGRIQASTTRN